MIPLWQAFLIFCIGLIGGWLIHVEYMALKKEEEETDQEYLDRKAVEKTKETAKKLLEGL